MSNGKEDMVSASLEDISQLRDVARRFARRSITPYAEEWEERGDIGHGIMKELAEAGLLGVGYPEVVGGQGGKLTERLVVMDEFLREGVPSGACAAMFGRSISVPHMVSAGVEYLIETYVRPTLSGDRIGALAVTEPGGGSDVAALQTSARRGQTVYTVNGAKTFISSGVRADYYVTAVRTGRGGARGISLLVIDRDTPGVTVSVPMRKMGWRASDTAELHFDDVQVPLANIVGAEGVGFGQLLQQFPSERVTLAAHGVGMARRCIDLCIPWVKSRVTFGRPLVDRQVIRHKLAEMESKTRVAASYVYSVAQAMDAGEDMHVEAAIAKNVAVEAASFVVDEAVQIFGGTGYIDGVEVERHYRDARILGIGGGTTEILREIIAADVIS